ncbi:MAG: DUF6770 family protein [Nonlabens sp.]
MKHTVTILSLFLALQFGFGQSKSLSGLTSFKLRNSGVMMDKNENVDGYYFFHEVDKLKKGKREFAITILDKNLNEVAKKSYVDHKKTSLLDVHFNNQALMFTLLNTKEKVYKLLTMSREGDIIDTQTVPYKSKMHKKMVMAESSGIHTQLTSADDKGFILANLVDNRKTGYEVKFYATDGGENWVYGSDPEDKYHLMFNIIDANNEMIIGQEVARKSMFNSKGNVSIVALDINSGKELWRIENEKDVEPRFAKNAFVNEDNQTVILGEYFPKKKNWYSAKSVGLYSQTIDRSGNIVSDKKLSWSKDIRPKMPAAAKFEKEKETVFFHDIVKADDGSIYAIGEKFKMNLNALGIIAGGSKTKLVITDAMIFKFSPDFKLEDVIVQEKGKSRVASITDGGSAQQNALFLKAYGAFDHNFTQVEPDRNRFIATFTDYERIKGKKNKYAFIAIAVEDGEVTQDKIYMEDSKKNTRYRIMPAQAGRVTIIEYNWKKKTVDVRLEQLNL